MLVYEACLKTGIPSNTIYYRLAVCERLARDLNLNLDELLARLPVPVSNAAHLFDPYQPHPLGISSRSGYRGPANTIEDVR